MNLESVLPSDTRSLVSLGTFESIAPLQMHLRHVSMFQLHLLHVLVLPFTKMEPYYDPHRQYERLKMILLVSY